MKRKRTIVALLTAVAVSGPIYGAINITPDSLNIDCQTSSRPLQMNIGLPGGFIMQSKNPERVFKIHIPASADTVEFRSPSISGNGCISFYKKGYGLKQAMVCNEIFTMSDERNKKDIEEIAQALPSVLGFGQNHSLPTARSAKSAAERPAITSQELEYRELMSMAPSAVEIVDGDTMVNYMEIIPLLIKSVQELNGIVAEQDRLIEELTTQTEAKKSAANRLGRITGCTPNPTTGMLHISYLTAQSGPKYTLTIIDTAGNRVASQPCSGQDGEATMSIAGCRNGIYHVILSADNTVADTYKVIKK